MERDQKGDGWLVLARRSGERIVIGDGEDQVLISVYSIVDGVVRLAIKAPKDVPVHREEVYEQIKSQESKND